MALGSIIATAGTIFLISSIRLAYDVLPYRDEIFVSNSWLGITGDAFTILSVTAAVSGAATLIGVWIAVTAYRRTKSN